ncbi:hypothetical protein AB0L86_10255 [Micromonospora musae]|uniref:hypothetical protein n=1 Tax=Micromonospora musae TaxID=1894970 RepID=UPI00343CA7EA
MGMEAQGTRAAVPPTAGRRRATSGPPRLGPRPRLDYYLILDRPAGPDAVAEAIVVEEFVRATDWTTVGLRSAGWTPAGAGWWSSAAYSRAMRADPELRARVFPVARAEADAAHRRLGGAALPDEPVLRAGFHDDQALPVTAPLRLGPSAPDGYHERRTYRVLFAGDPLAHRLAELATRWRPADGRSTVDALPAGRRRVDDDRFAWTVRRVGRGLAWSLDLTVLLAGADDRTVGPLLHELTSAVRLCGLVPMTTERFD